MALAWLVTLPSAAAVGAVAASVVVHGGTTGVVVIALAAVAVAGVIVVLSRRNPVHADNVNSGRTASVRPVAPPARASEPDQAGEAACMWTGTPSARSPR